jgi:hypothetical protein
LRAYDVTPLSEPVRIKHAYALIKLRVVLYVCVLQITDINPAKYMYYHCVMTSYIHHSPGFCPILEILSWNVGKHTV